MGEGQAHLAAPDKGEAMKICPTLRAANIASGASRISWEKDVCLGKDCELWIERFGRCCMAVDAYLKGQADWRAEAQAEAKSERDRSEI